MRSRIFVEYVANETVGIKHKKKLGTPQETLDAIRESDVIDLDTRQILWIDLLDEDGNSVASWDSGVNYD